MHMSFEFDEINKGNNYLVGGSLFEKLQLGDPTSFHAIRERLFDEDTSFDISSLSWMERSASDVINSRYFLFFFSFTQCVWLLIMKLYVVYIGSLHSPKKHCPSHGS